MFEVLVEVLQAVPTFSMTDFLSSYLLNCKFVRLPSLNRDLNMVDGFQCLDDPRSYVDWSLNAPGSFLTHTSLGDRKERFKTPL